MGRKRDAHMYRSLIESLLYMENSRHDITFTSGLLLRFVHSPNMINYGAAKRMLRYLKWIQVLMVYGTLVLMISRSMGFIMVIRQVLLMIKEAIHATFLSRFKCY